MFTSLYSRIAAGLAMLFLLIGLIFIGVTVFSTDMYQQEVNQKLNTGLARQIVKEWLLMDKGVVNDHALREAFHMLMVVNPGIEIYLLDIEGNILTYSAPRGSVKRRAVDMEPVLARLADPEGSVLIQGDDPRGTDRKKVFSAAPITREGRLEGYLYVILGGEQYDTVVDKLKGSYIIQLSTWMMGAGLIFTFASGLVLFALLTGRLKKLVAAVDGFRPGKDAADLNLPMAEEEGGNDEIHRLARTFKGMAVRIQRQMSALDASDKLRRELVANVSHDLRTPLATLQGYMETMLINEGRHSPEERRHYLEVAIKHCLRLNRLVSELLELARMESAEMKISPEPFLLDELAGDIVQKFSLRARASGIRLEILPPERPAFVMADIALVERALENLIENGLRHTPAQGRVGVEISSGNSVRAAVRDTGPGIPEDELPFIFNRFFHAGGEMDDDTRHTGLGLAITQKIVELHGSRLGVETGPEGTCFSFGLPRSSPGA
ncbi:MAG: HAMP domain-containing histidine kinase [Desulfobacter sp.]|nr:MAG: HAMP domain-containing histidine kinase [Desulfobacter sp.]